VSAHDTMVLDAIRAAIKTSVDALCENEASVRDTGAVEAVHDARLATRRLRSALRTFRDLLEPTWTRALLEELGWLGEHLGLVRDADVVLGHIEAFADRLPLEDRTALAALLEPMRERRKIACDALIVEMSGERFARLLALVRDAGVHPPITPGAFEIGRKQLVRLIRRPWRRLKRDVARLGDHPSDAELHRIRIRVRRVRYALEAVAPVASKRGSPVIERITQLQEILGDVHDLAIEREQLRMRARTSDDAAFAAGEIAGVDLSQAARARRSWRRAWHRAARKRLRFW